jgi:hypothetical protein
MNFMMYGLPVVAYVDPRSEVAHIVEESGGGWVLDNSRPEDFARSLREITSSNGDVARRGEAALAYATARFSLDSFARSFDEVLRAVR